MADRRLHLVLPTLFLFVAGQLGLFLALAVPLGQVPDEPQHVIRADSLLGGEVIAHREVTVASDARRHPQQGLDGDPGLQLTAGASTFTRASFDAARAQPWSGPAFIPLGSIAGYWPIFYVPAAIGLGIAKRLAASPFEAFYIARLANLAAFLGIGLAALLLARRGQALLFCTLAVPMTLHLAASVNQDGLLIAATALAAALLTRPGRPASTPDDAAPGRIWDDAPRLGAALLLGSVAMAKPPYLPLAGVLLLPFPTWAQRRAWLERFGLVALVAAATLGWTWMVVRTVTTPGYRMPAEAGPLWPGPRPTSFSGTDMAAQLRVLLAKPTRLLKLPWRTLREHWNIWDQAIGVLGHLDILLPPWLYRLWGWALAAAAAADLLRRRADAAAVPLRQAPWPLLCVAAAWLGIYLSQYLSWSQVGAALIEGPQGRYLLPLLPVLALALPSLPPAPALRATLTLLPAAACLAGAAAVPGVILRFYYLH